MIGKTKRQKTISSKTLFFFGRIILGAIFIFASLDKIYHPAAFAQIVSNYQILSGLLWINLTAILLPWIELLLGVCLISGRWMHGAIFLSNLILIIFIGLLMFNLSRGLDVSCGCFSTQTIQFTSTLWDIGRDSLFLAIAIYLQINTFLPLNPKSIDS